MDARSWQLLRQISGVGGVGLIGLLALPAIRQLGIKARSARHHYGSLGHGADASASAGYEAVPQLFECADGQATPESEAAFSDRWPRGIAWVSLVLGLASAIAASTLLSVYSAKADPTLANQSLLAILNRWADVPAWALLLLQCASIPTRAQYDRRVRLVHLAYYSDVLLLASLLFRHGANIVYVLGGSSRSASDRSLMDGIAICWLAGIALSLTACLAFASFPSRPDVYYEGVLVDQQHAVSMISRFFFSWNRDVFTIAKQRRLEPTDLPGLDSDTRSSCINARYLSRYLSRHGSEDTGNSDGSGKYSKRRLWWELLCAFKWTLALQWTLTLVRAVLGLFPQYIVYKFLENLETPAVSAGDDDKHKASNPQLWGWVLGLGISLVLEVWIGSIQRWLTSSRLEMPLSSLVQTLVFQKALRLEEAAEPGDKADGEKTDGKTAEKDKPAKPKGGDVRQSVINHMKLDSSRMTMFCSFNYWIPLAVSKVFLVGALLCRLLGWKAFLAGFGSTLFVYPLSHFISKKFAAIQFGLMRFRDAKSNLLTEALQGMRQIKYSALEQLYEKKISNARREELEQYWRASVWMTITILVVNLGPTLLSCVSLAVYTFTTPTHVRASVIFASLGLFDQLDEATTFLPLIQVYLLEAWTSCSRIETYLNRPEKTSGITPGDSIVFSNATVRWPRAEVADEPTASSGATAASSSSPSGAATPVQAVTSSPVSLTPSLASAAATAVAPESEEQPARSVLRNINAEFPTGKLTLITGKTGAGKSLLLAAILGEAKLVSGSISMPQLPPASMLDDADVADDDWILPSLTSFVSQTPWIESGTLRDNIVFGLPFRESRYQKVLRACALDKDIELLADGDATAVGPKGVTLSGGQRWRLALARALYSRAGIVILDDVLSAVDAHVGGIIVNEALGGELAEGRTRILATHHHEMCLAHASYLVRLDNGRVLSAEAITPSESVMAESSAAGAATAADAGEAAEEAETEAAGKDTKATAKKADEETRETGRVKTHVYRQYFVVGNAAKFWLLFLVLLVLGRLSKVGSTWALKVLSSAYAGDSDVALNMSSSYLTGHGRPSRLMAQVSAPELGGWHYPSMPTLSMPAMPTLAAVAVDDEDFNYRRDVIFWIVAYIVLDIGFTLMAVSQILVSTYSGLRASKVMFQRMIHAILRAPLRWIDTVPSGRILNRCTSDTFLVDRRLSPDICQSMQSFSSLVAVIAASMVVSPYIIVCGVVLMVLYTHTAIDYISAAREIKRINSVANSPIFDQFSSVLNGLSTIRAFNRVDFYMRRMYSLIDSAARSSWALQLLTRWMNFRLGMYGAVFVTAVAICIVFGNISASLAGFGLVFALRYTDSLTSLLSNMANIELGFNAAERIIEYMELETEPEDGEDVPAAWPSSGHITVENVTVSYAKDLPPVLKNLNFEVRPGERIGIVGRTGAGKSTLAAVFFRLLVPDEGSIHIDGLDISKLKLSQLRSRLAIIPQDPFLFSGTLRANLDLENEISDHDLHDVLKRVHLVAPQSEELNVPVVDATEGAVATEVPEEVIAEAEEETARFLEPSGADPMVESDIANLPKDAGVSVSDASTEVGPVVSSGSSDDKQANDAFTNLAMPISIGGGNLSQGQRQLLCLARALLTRPKIIVLDEATSAVDRGTDGAIQESLRKEFAAGGCTVLVIAHRLSTVVDFDRLLVLKEGHVAEMGTPKELMERGMALDEQRSARKTVEGEAEEEEDGDAGAFWELVKRSAEKEKLMQMVFGEKK